MLVVLHMVNLSRVKRLKREHWLDSFDIGLCDLKRPAIGFAWTHVCFDGRRVPSWLGSVRRTYRTNTHPS
jgi:hypothetical protein